MMDIRLFANLAAHTMNMVQATMMLQRKTAGVLVGMVGYARHASNRPAPLERQYNDVRSNLSTAIEKAKRLELFYKQL